MVQALTGANDGSFTRLEVLADGTMTNVLELIGSSSYDDTQIVQDVVTVTAATVVNSATAAANAAAIATQAAAVSANSTAIAGKVDNSRVLSDVPAAALFTDTIYTHPASHSMAEISGLSSALDDKLDEDQRPQIKYQGSYVDMQKLEFGDSTLSLGAASGEYQIQSTPQLANVQGLTAALAGKQATLSNAADLDVTSSAQQQLNARVTTTALTAALALKQDLLSNAADLDVTSSAQQQLNARVTTTAHTAALALKQDVLSNAADLDVTSSAQQQLNDKRDISDSYSKAEMDALSLTVAPLVHSHATTDVSGNGLTLGTTAPSLTLTRGNVTTEFYVDSGGSSIINWDKFSHGSSYLGIKHSGSWQTYLTASGTFWVSSSDSRLKNVLGPIQGMCEKLKSVQPVYFEFKADQTKTIKAGLLAQEVQAICPQIVTTDPEGWLGIAYQDVVPLLLASIRELTTRVEALEATNTRKTGKKPR